MREEMAVRMNVNEKTLKVSDEKMSRSRLVSHRPRLGLVVELMLNVTDLVRVSPVKVLGPSLLYIQAE